MPDTPWIVLALLSLPLGFVLAELSARAWIRWRKLYFTWPPYTRFLMPLDPKVFHSGDAAVSFEVNRWGERGDPPPRSMEGVYRVLVAGGSAAECYYLDQRSSWPGALQRMLEEPQHLAALAKQQVHVGNIARSLVPCRAIHYQLSKVLPQLPHSDAALLMVGASDLVTWLENKTPSNIDPGGFALDSIFGIHPETSFGWTPSTLALRRALSSMYRAWMKPLDRREVSGKRLAANRAMRANAKHLLNSIADPQPMLERYEHDLRQVLRVLRQHSTRVIVIQQMWLERAFTESERSQTWMFAAGRPYKESVDSYYAHAVIWPLMRRIYEISGRVAREEGVEALDLQGRVPSDLEHYYDDMHHTPKGCALVARLVAEHLARTSPAA